MRKRTALLILAFTGTVSASCAASMDTSVSDGGDTADSDPVATDTKPTVLSVTSGSYSASSAVTYAKRYCGISGEKDLFNTTGYSPYYQSYNPNDCANFVSQALAFGGWQPVGGTCWWCDSSWYYLSAGDHNRSNSWANVLAFRTFMVNSGRTNGAVSIPQSLSTIPRFYAGDVILADWEGNGSWDHVYLVTSQADDDVLLAAHTTNRCGDITLRGARQQKPSAVFQGFRLRTQY